MKPHTKFAFRHKNSTLICTCHSGYLATWIIQSKGLQGLLLHEKAGNDCVIYKASGSIMAQQQATTSFYELCLSAANILKRRRYENMYQRTLTEFSPFNDAI